MYVFGGVHTPVHALMQGFIQTLRSFPTPLVNPMTQHKALSFPLPRVCDTSFPRSVITDKENYNQTPLLLSQLLPAAVDSRVHILFYKGVSVIIW